MREYRIEKKGNLYIPQSFWERGRTFLSLREPLSLEEAKQEIVNHCKTAKINPDTIEVIGEK